MLQAADGGEQLAGEVRHALLPRGQAFAAQPVAQQGGVGVAAVFHPCQLVRLGVGEQLGAGNG